MKKRYKFLEHIPTYAEISFVDVKMKDLLRKKYFKQFQEDYQRKNKKKIKKKELELKYDRSVKEKKMQQGF